jgi:hypothetical protein
VETQPSTKLSARRTAAKSVVAWGTTVVERTAQDRADRHPEHRPPRQTNVGGAKVTGRDARRDRCKA